MKKISGVFQIFIFAISMLILTDIEVAGMKLSVFLLFLLVAGQAFCQALQIRSRRDRFRIECRTDLMAAVLFLFGLLSLIAKLFQKSSEGGGNYQFQVVLMLCVFVYFSFREIQEFPVWYFDCLLYVSLIGMAMLLFYYLCDKRMVWMVAGLVEDSGKTASYLMLPCLISTLRYCMCRDKFQSLFYFMTAAVSFLCLFLNHNIASFWIMTMVFLAVPVAFRATAELVKRDMQILFVFFFLLGNMGLLTNYTELFRGITVFELENSIYVEILLAMGGFIFFHYWKRIPEGADLDRLVLRKLSRGYWFALKFIGILFAGIIAGGSGFRELPEGIGYHFAKSFAVPLAEEIGQGRSGFVQGCKTDIAGFLLLLVMAVFVIGRFRKNYSLDKPMTNIFLLAAYVFFLQCLFWIPSVHVLPVYTMMIAMEELEK